MNDSAKYLLLIIFWPITILLVIALLLIKMLRMFNLISDQKNKKYTAKTVDGVCYVDLKMIKADECIEVYHGNYCYPYFRCFDLEGEQVYPIIEHIDLHRVDIMFSEDFNGTLFFYLRGGLFNVRY